MATVSTDQIEKILTKIHKMDYYQILNVDRHAGPDQVRLAYFRQSKKFHPDRFFRQVSDEQHRMISEIYKTIAEAYRILNNSSRRRAYDKLLESDRENNLRFDPKKVEEQANERKRVWRETISKNPMARKYVKMAIDFMKAKNFQQADVNVKLALGIEQDNEDLKELAEEIAKKAKKGAAKDNYTIR